MKPVIVILSMLLLFSPLAEGRGLDFTKRVGDYDVDVRIDRNPPIIGDNHIEIEIRDGSKKPVKDAKVLVNYYMPPMPRMAPMNYRIDASLKGDQYKATMKFIMAGPWIIAIKITRGEKTTTAKVNVDAQ
jgi:hypothetical protein